MAASSTRGLRVVKAIQEYVKAYPNQFDTSSILAKVLQDVNDKVLLNSFIGLQPMNQSKDLAVQNPVKFIDVTDKIARAKFTVEPKMCNLMKTVHGGYMTSVMDAVFVVHLLSCRDGKLAWTTNLNVHFISPAAVGEQVTVESTPAHISNGSILMQAKAINDATGMLVATGMMSFVYGREKFQKVGEQVLKLDFSQND